MLNIAIVDDEAIFLNHFEEILSGFLLDEYQLEPFQSAKDFLSISHDYDYVFLDIDMPLINGISLAQKRLADHKSEHIIFVTNKEAMVFDAYNKTTSIGFIRKNHLSEDLKDVLNTMRTIKLQPKSIAITKSSQVIKIDCKDIYYFEKQKNNIIVHTFNDTINYRGTMKSLEKDTEGCGFIKTHEGYIVNLDFIYRVNATDVVLINQERVPISRKNTRNIKERLLRRVGERNV